MVYPQECNSPREEWRRWRRWIVDTRSVCACIKDFYLAASVSSVYFLCCWLCFMALGFISLPGLMNSSPPGRMVWCWQCLRLIWIGVVCVIGAFSAWFHRCWLLVPLAPLSVVYVLLAYAIWIIYGLIAFFTAREPQRDKPTRYSALVEASTAYSQPSVTGTEKLSEA